MAAIITTEIRTQNTINFYSGYFPSSGTSNNSLYMTFGRPNAWDQDINSKVEDVPGFIVPQPGADLSSGVFRTELIAGYKIKFEEFCPVVRRINWEVDTVYSLDDVVITDEYNVYRTVVGSINNNTKPTHTDGVLNDWEFLYKITNADYINNFMTNDWIPVYYAGNVGSVGSPDVESMLKSKCRHLMSSVSLSENKLPNAMLHDFRKIALWSTPLRTDGSFMNDDTFVDGFIRNDSGTVIYVDHRLPLFRSVDQVEQFRIIIGF